MTHGGVFHHYQNHKTTHIIASNLPDVKVRALKGDEKIVRILFMSRANASIVDNEDRAPIHLAAERGHTTIVEFLVDNFKASVHERTRDGSTLMHIAAHNGHPETAMALLNKGVTLLL